MDFGLYFGSFLARKMENSKTRVYQEALIAHGVPENLARNAAVVLNQETWGNPRTERGQRVIQKAHEAMIKNEIR